MKVFISGGCKNGKSTYAEKVAVMLSAHAKPLYYVATMLPTDKEDEERIARHRSSRKDSCFDTIEIPRDVVKLKDNRDLNGTFLLDSVTALLANEMFLPHSGINSKAYEKIAVELSELFRCVKNIVVVSDYIYSGAAIYGELTEQYRRGLAFIDKCCAASCDVVIEACCGNFIVYKGKGMLDEIDKQAM